MGCMPHRTSVIDAPFAADLSVMRTLHWCRVSTVTARPTWFHLGSGVVALTFASVGFAAPTVVLTRATAEHHLQARGFSCHQDPNLDDVVKCWKGSAPEQSASAELQLDSSGAVAMVYGQCYPPVSGPL